MCWACRRSGSPSPAFRSIPRFAEPVDRTEIRYQQPPRPGQDRPCWFPRGALGVTPAEFVVARLLQLRHDVQGIVICGRNEELRHRLKEMLGPHGARFKVIGYTDKMHEYMKISDLFIGKPGGLTTAEALACSLPMIIVDPIPGQEERNSDHLLEKGCALKANELTTLAWKIDQLLDEPGRLETMRHNAGETRAAECSADHCGNADQRSPSAAATGCGPAGRNRPGRDRRSALRAQWLRSAAKSCPGIFSGASPPPRTRARAATTAPASPGPTGRAPRRSAAWPRAGRPSDFWTRYQEDFQRVRGLGLNAFRLGIEWSRIQPGFKDGKSGAAAVRHGGAGSLRADADRLPRAGAGAGADAAPFHASRMAWNGPVAGRRDAGAFREVCRDEHRVSQRQPCRRGA